MGIDFGHIYDQTPLEENEKEGLLIETITTREELGEFEQLNIENAIQWTLLKKFNFEYLLTEQFVKELHYKMFCDVWSWAGHFRTTDHHPGVAKDMIGTSLKQLIDNFKYWIEDILYQEDEAVIRFKHEILKIRCFPKGNGRHSRLIADVLRSSIFGLPPFTWNEDVLSKYIEARSTYTSPIEEVDKDDDQLLIDFSK